MYEQGGGGVAFSLVRHSDQDVTKARTRLELKCQPGLVLPKKLREKDAEENGQLSATLSMPVDKM